LNTIQSWLKFDLSSLPPGATITSADLALTLNFTTANQYIGVYGETDNSWNELGITWDNAPLGSVSSTSVASDFVTNDTSYYTFSILSLLSGSSQISLVLQPTSPSATFGYTQFWSLEEGGSLGPSLTITYSPVSVSISPPSSSIQYGSSITVSGNTIPEQSLGTFELQYSTDESTWYTLASKSGGSAQTLWTPPSVGTFYLRGVWDIPWGSGSYTVPSGISTLTVNAAPSNIQLSLSESTLTLGKSVNLDATITPNTVSDGTVVIQESPDGSTWTVLGSGPPTSGAFSYSWTPSEVGTYYLRATWSGDQNYLSSTSAEQTLTVQKIQTSISLSIPKTTQLGKSISITATLLDASQHRISGAQITFQFDSSGIGTAITGSDGTASIVYTPTVSAGTYTVGVFYGGSTDYASSESLAHITIVPWKLTISSTVAGASLVEFDGRTYDSDNTGQILILVNSSGTYSLSANSPIEISSGARAVFIGWSDGTNSTSKTLDITSDLALTLVTKVQYLLTLQSEYGNPGQSGWYDSGSHVSISVYSPVDQGNGTRRVVLEWVEDNQQFLASGNGTAVMNSPTNLQALWKKQYLVSVDATGGNATGAGWYDAGSEATVRISPTTYGFIIQHVFTGWQNNMTSNDGVSTFAVNDPITLQAQWRTDYTQLIILVAIIGAGVAGVGGYVWIRGKGGPSEPGIPEGPTPQQSEATEAPPRVEHRQEIETGTSVYAPSPCPKCGLANPVGATYCAYCGADLNPQ
jgi:hypothetical protein